jgi:hypothetical protein
MKRTDLEKHKALKLMGQMHHAATPGRFGQGAGALPDRREQRKMDQAAGLVPFAVKLHQDLVRQLQGLAVQEGIGLGELTARLLTAGLSASADQTDAKPAKKAVAKKAAAKKAAAKTAPSA